MAVKGGYSVKFPDEVWMKIQAFKERTGLPTHEAIISLVLRGLDGTAT